MDKIKIYHRISGRLIFKGKKADLQRANLQGADLQGANLWEADLQRANLQGADLQGANLWEADLQRANLQGADLQEANLWEADLREADLRGADLRGADLRGADLDFSVLPLHCGSFSMKVDDRLVYQLIAHMARFDISQCSDGVKRFYKRSISKKIANKFCSYRIDVTPI